MAEHTTPSPGHYLRDEPTPGTSRLSVMEATAELALDRSRAGLERRDRIDELRKAIEQRRVPQIADAPVEEINEPVDLDPPEVPEMKEPAYVPSDAKSRTVIAVERVNEGPNFREADERSPYGYYHDMPIIGRESDSVDGGVYLGGSSREAIVVDGESPVLQEVYVRLEQELEGSGRLQGAEDVLNVVKEKVRESMLYDDQKVGLITTAYAGDQLVKLSKFVEEDAGVCRHQGLLAAYLTERLIQSGRLDGGIGVERNTRPDMGGTHGWAVYKPIGVQDEAEHIVIDPAQDFVGTKSQAVNEGRWDYRLVEREY